MGESAEGTLTEADLSVRRLKACIENWPECWSGDYNPAYCRFPKSCSPHGYIEAVCAGNLTENDLEPRPAPRHPLVPAAPDALRVRLAEAWDQGARAGATDDPDPGWFIRNNPYLAEETQ